MVGVNNANGTSVDLVVLRQGDVRGELGDVHEHGGGGARADFLEVKDIVSADIDANFSDDTKGGLQHDAGAFDRHWEKLKPSAVAVRGSQRCCPIELRG